MTVVHIRFFLLSPTAVPSNRRQCRRGSRTKLEGKKGNWHGRLVRRRALLGRSVRISKILGSTKVGKKTLTAEREADVGRDTSVAEPEFLPEYCVSGWCGSMSVVVFYLVGGQ